jgi:hypothetical protein
MPVAFGVGLAERFRRRRRVPDRRCRAPWTPRGGTGLNTAIRDGFDIGWRLAWVLRGWAHDGLLEGYERERRPVAEFNTLRSARTDGSILSTAAGLNSDIGGRVAHVWLPRNGQLVSTLDLLTEGLTLFAGPACDECPASNRSGSPPVALERLDAIAARALGLSTAGSLPRGPTLPVALWNHEAPSGARLARTIAAFVADTGLVLSREPYCAARRQGPPVVVTDAASCPSCSGVSRCETTRCDLAGSQSPSV